MLKKLFLAMCMTMFSVVGIIAATAESATFTVTSPEPGKTYYMGNSMTITWTQQGYTGQIVALAIKGPKVLLIKADVPASGGGIHQFQWTIPNDLLEGQYQVMIGGKDGAQATGGSFWIKKKAQVNLQGLSPDQPDCKIIVTSPATYQTCYINEICMISWDRSSANPVHFRLVNVQLVQIDAQHPSGMVGAGGVNYQNLVYDKDVAWIPENVVPLDATYRIRITVNGKSGPICMGQSGIFNIKKRAQKMVPNKSPINK